jgi:predicted alpha/beta superfamily hydrolase
MRVCHPEPESFAGEGSAVRKKAKEKADSSPPFKNRTGLGMTYFRVFRSLLEPELQQRLRAQFADARFVAGQSLDGFRRW